MVIGLPPAIVVLIHEPRNERIAGDLTKLYRRCLRHYLRIRPHYSEQREPGIGRFQRASSTA